MSKAPRGLGPESPQKGAHLPTGQDADLEGAVVLGLPERKKGENK